MLEGFGAQPARQAQKPAPFILVNPVPSTPCAAGPAPGCLGRLFWGSCCFPVPQRSPVSPFPPACRYVARKMRTLWSREPRDPPPCPAQAAPQSHHRSKCGDRDIHAPLPKPAGITRAQPGVGAPPHSPRGTQDQVEVAEVFCSPSFIFPRVLLINIIATPGRGEEQRAAFGRGDRRALGWD